ncbi:hypothetical protein SIID45300_01666 [Candidatus Magnetaquicoccaceae bacterium FCR-1]|uniref:Uncharacterized protein n=1 Tax=Candidatus Magnetaquiglobus chichijimensis TaxID=3141448 RepID=A0ABQ0C8X9_9PROT
MEHEQEGFLSFLGELRRGKTLVELDDTLRQVVGAVRDLPALVSGGALIVMYGLLLLWRWHKRRSSRRWNRCKPLQSFHP